jgi:hypothetical protein
MTDTQPAPELLTANRAGDYRVPALEIGRAARSYNPHDHHQSRLCSPLRAERNAVSSAVVNWNAGP